MVRRQKAHDPTKATRHKPTEVEVRNVAHPRIWQTAINLTGGDASRIKVESYGCLTLVVAETAPTEQMEATG